MTTLAAPDLPRAAAPIGDELEVQLDAALPSAETAPQVLHRAMRHAVFPGGKRLRPRLLLAVAWGASAGPAAAERELALRAACAVELVHCASLAHDDLPCFDDAATRRGRPTVHARFGEATAVLVGDALLSRAFELLADGPARLAPRALRILGALGRATGSRDGIAGGQGLEDAREPRLPGLVERYHAQKTAALFRLACEAGALATGAVDVAAWGEVGQHLGLALQLGDDLADVHGDEADAGKPLRRDAALGRPNAALSSGVARARGRLTMHLGEATGRARALALDPAPVLDLIRALAPRA